MDDDDELTYCPDCKIETKREVIHSVGVCGQREDGSQIHEMVHESICSECGRSNDI